MLDADSVKKEYAVEDQDEEDHDPEEKISYHLAGPPKLCSKCWEGFPIEEFANHDCMGVKDPKEEDEISYHLPGPPKMCSTCLEAFPIEEFPPLTTFLFLTLISRFLIPILFFGFAYFRIFVFSVRQLSV